MRIPRVDGGALSAVPDIPSPAQGVDQAAERGGPDRRAGAAAMALSCNVVRLTGRLGLGLRELTLPSGDEVVSFHLVVARPPRGAQAQERRPREPTVDTLACAAWTSRSRRSVLASEPGDLMEVEGALRRRFRRSSGGSPVSFYEVEASRVRRVRPGGR